MSYLDFTLKQFRNSAPANTEVHVLIQFQEDRLAEIEALGFRTTSIAGEVAAGSIPLSRLQLLENHPAVLVVESSRPPKIETDVSYVAINLLDPHAGLNTIPGNGRGALIGVIDSGFELTHPGFLDRNKKTRIISCWDQANISNAAGNPPLQFTYGVEYTSAMIDEQNSLKKILIVEQIDGAAGHGTYVTGIAAGNGVRHGTYRGMAPEADLILVAYRNDVFVGGSAFILDAIHYIQRAAEAMRRPVVINMSFGDNLGAHDGTSPLEKAIDHLVGQGKLLVVKSAGNERGQPAPHHAQVQVENGKDVAVPFTLTEVNEDTLEIWYRRGDLLAVALQPPGSPLSEFVEPGMSAPIPLPQGNRALVYSHVDHPANGDNHIGIIFEPGGGTAGVWNLIFRGNRVVRGDVDVWSDRPNGITSIEFQGFQADAGTITLPGTGRRIITVGGFVSRPEERGETGDVTGGISLGSSIGPTRDGRVKPDITAPSSLIMAPRARTDSCPLSYDLQTGTSMAAPHVSGVIALLWALWPNLNSLQLRATLIAAARNDNFTGATPNTSWGNGKLDAGAVYRELGNKQRNGEMMMNDNKYCQMEVELEKIDGTVNTVTLNFEIKGHSVVGVRGTDQYGDKYNVDFVFSRAGGGECYVCTVDPCPPNRYREVNPCPIGMAKKQHNKDERER